MNGHGLQRFRCHVGHAYTRDALLADQQQSLEMAMWNAVRVLEERVKMLERMSSDAERNGHRHSGMHFRERAGEARAQMELIRDMLMRLRPVSNETAP